MGAKISLDGLLRAVGNYSAAQIANSKKNKRASADHKKVTAFNQDTLRQELGPLAALVEFEEQETGLADREQATFNSVGPLTGRMSAKNPPRSQKPGRRLRTQGTY